MKIPGRIRSRRASTSGAPPGGALPAAGDGELPAGGDGELPAGGGLAVNEPLAGEVARLAGELAEDASPSRWRRFQAAATRLARRGGRACQPARAGSPRVDAG